MLHRNAVTVELQEMQAAVLRHRPEPYWGFHPPPGRPDGVELPTWVRWCFTRTTLRPGELDDPHTRIAHAIVSDLYVPGDATPATSSGGDQLRGCVWSG